MKLSKKYKPFFEVLKGKHPEVHTVIVTGGRDSGKSFGISLGTCEAVAQYNHRALYTRYTLTSAKDSIIPDFNEKIELLGLQDWFHTTKDRITTVHNDGKIVFKGIKTSSGNQTAALKSLKDFSMFICEEAEEFPSYDEWDKIQLSIRATDVQALNVLILNPTTKKHWIYDTFFADKGVKGGFNGIKNGVLYIHTTYLDLGREFIAPKNWAKYEEARIIFEQIDKLTKEERIKQPKKLLKKYKYYKYVVMGGWLDSADGVIFEDYELFKDWPEEAHIVKGYGLDFGYSGDPTAFIEERIYKDSIYLKEQIYETGLLNHELADRIQDVVGNESCYIVADHARPDLIDDLNRIAAEKGYNWAVIPCVKGPNSVRDGLEKMKTKDIYIHEDSTNLIDEADNYHAKEIVNAKGETIYHIVDKFNHGFDAARYFYNLYL